MKTFEYLLGKPDSALALRKRELVETLAGTKVIEEVNILWRINALQIAPNITSPPHLKTLSSSA